MGIWCNSPGVVSGNVVKNAGGSGIVLGDTYVTPTAIICSSNRVYSCGGTYSAFTGGIYVNDAAEKSIVSSNYIYDSFQYSVQVVSDGCLVVGNQLITAGTGTWLDTGAGNVRRSNIGVADS
jgi:hypothetical protein